MQDRRWQIQITDSLESRFPEKFLAEASQPMKALFRKLKYGEGITAYVSKIIEELKRPQVTNKKAKSND